MADSIQRAVELFHERNMDEAKAMCMRLLAADGRNVDCLNLLGIITGRFEQDPAGIEHIYKAIKLAPERADLRHNLGGILGQFGQRAAACESFQQAIDRNNFYGEAWQGLAESTKGTPPREYVEKLEQIVATPDLSSDQVCYLNFALARFLENACEYDRAFKHYVIANKAKSTQFDWQDHDHWVQSTRRIFTQELFERMGSVGSSSRRPVFVIGMPRSGTSLVEQIIASHPEVHGAGELPDMNSIARTTSNYTKSGALYPESIAELPQEAILGMGRAYLDRISGMAPRTAVRVVDKHPLNFRLVGLIRLLFPYSTIIHCARDPLDTCLSCYFQNFSHGQAYSFDLAELGRFYRDYQLFMEHWKRVLPGAVHTVEYEQLVTEPEKLSRKLIEVSGLLWHDSCLIPWETRRPVATASKHQVTEKIHSRSIGKWRHYEAGLLPLKQALGMV